LPVLNTTIHTSIITIMDLLAQYADSDDEKNDQPQAGSDGLLAKLKMSINAAPIVKDDVVPRGDYLNPNKHMVYYNPTVDEMYAPLKGPEVPYASLPIGVASTKNTLTGYVQDDHVNDFDFRLQYNEFTRRGVAANPTQPAGTYIVSQFASQTEPEKKKKKKKGERKPESDPGNVDTFRGTWGMPAEIEFPTEGTLEGEGDEGEGEPAEEGTEGPRPEAADKVVQMEEEVPEEEGEGQEGEGRQRKYPEASSQMHIEEETDYMGRTWVDPPSHMKPWDGRGESTVKCFLPKKRIHTWSGHAKGVSSIRFFPGYGHLLLSSSMDSTIKIWEVYNKRRCVQTYEGHSKAVREVQFSSDGRQFLSASYDRLVRLWDTETGKVLGTYSTGKTPYCVKFHPTRPNLFLVGQQDKKIVEWNTETNKIIQTYDRHLGAVNTITFLEDGRRFVTTADDKSIRIWDHGIPVDAKYIAEPHMHSMPAATLHPNGKWFLAQSLDNQIVVYSAKDRFKANRKKRFTGHLSAGYACQVSVSPDGKYVMSGDSIGQVWFWSWKNAKVFKRLACHKGVAIGCEWHPTEPSKIATCGWDGTIKYWD
jgi:pre-mRNA-processing factor 17